MRKQYHFRWRGGQLVAWDVGRLCGLVESVGVREVGLGEIRELDEPYWYELGGGVATCRSVAEHMRLVEAAELRFPIILCPQGRVMDGMHRVVKAYLAGHKTIRARQFLTLPAPDFVGVDPADLRYEGD